MTKKKKLTFAEHQQLGADLKKMDRRMVEISVQLGNAISKSSKENRIARRIERLISKLRSKLEDRMCAEIPGIKSLSDGEFFDVYYGHSEIGEKQNVPLDNEKASPSRIERESYIDH